MKLISFLFCLLVFTFSSCLQKKINLDKDFKENKIEAIYSKDISFDKFASKLAISLQNKAILNFIRREAIKQEDGDYDILLAKIKDEKVSYTNEQGRIQEKRFSELIFEQNNTRSINSYIDSLISVYPLLQISIPEQDGINLETLNTENIDPWIVVLPPDLDDQVVTQLKAYDTMGNQFWISALEQPNHLVIVVGESERITAVSANNDPFQGSNNRGQCDYPIPILQGAEYNYYLIDAVNDYILCVNENIMGDSATVGGGGSGTGGPIPQSCERDQRYDYDEIVKVRFSTPEALRNAEPWYKGKIELYCIISFGAPQPEGFNSLRKNFTRDRRDYIYENIVRWVQLNTETFMWAPNQLGDRICFRWYEYDGGKDISVKLNFTVTFPGNSNVSGEVTYNIAKKDDELGESWVYYCTKANGTPTEGTQFSTGSILFQVRER